MRTEFDPEFEMWSFDFDDIAQGDQVELSACRSCGALVEERNEELHTMWHRKLKA